MISGEAAIKTRSGRLVDLLAFSLQTEHLWTEIAPALSKIPRFCGQTQLPLGYSVAQHCVLMAEAAEDESADPALAALALLHDAHEAFLGDVITPALRALQATVADGLPPGASAAARRAAEQMVDRAWRGMKHALDGHILDAAHLGPVTDEQWIALHVLDGRALETEMADLMGEPQPPLRLPLRQGGAIRPWPVALAEERYCAALDRYLPAAARSIGRAA
ncbi:hypothetical protein [Notoacmeibacter sp. MSK16QG-6]|uniref:hypothetical protein n=1 Tax=Notoacmeibacter sp. MSK16QG-6 TaxID=2957982 RepID=UPI00209EF2B3|nr:hypothetical protein [Notoacmeibacter sp. MSK16QG-6]MCP1200089.1 hypothetical protein [Notoacmeibacter sp. MSK16QG-6]